MAQQVEPVTFDEFLSNAALQAAWVFASSTSCVISGYHSTVVARSAASQHSLPDLATALNITP
jgi:hypothetical protein